MSEKQIVEKIAATRTSAGLLAIVIDINKEIDKKGQTKDGVYHCFHHTMVPEVNELNTTSYEINRILPIVQGARVLELGRLLVALLGAAALIFIGGQGNSSSGSWWSAHNSTFECSAETRSRLGSFSNSADVGFWFTLQLELPGFICLAFCAVNLLLGVWNTALYHLMERDLQTIYLAIFRIFAFAKVDRLCEIHQKGYEEAATLPLRVTNELGLCLQRIRWRSYLLFHFSQPPLLHSLISSYSLDEYRRCEILRNKQRQFFIEYKQGRKGKGQGAKEKEKN